MINDELTMTNAKDYLGLAGSLLRCSLAEPDIDYPAMKLENCSFPQPIVLNLLMQRVAVDA